MVQTPRYVPEFDLTINGEPIPAALRASISGVNYQTGLEGADRVELSLVNENLRWLDHRLLAMDNRLTLSIGYAPDSLERVFVGEIVSQEASFPSGGSPTLTVSAQDRMQHLEQGTKTRWFAIPIIDRNLPLPDHPGVVDIVSLENGLIPIVDPIGATLAVVLGGIELFASWSDPQGMQKLIRKQEGQSDFDFLSLIARHNGWEMFIDHTGPLGGYQLRFMSPLDWLSSDLTLKYGQSLIDFTPRISKVGQIMRVSVRLWQPDIKMEFTVSVAWDWDRQSLDVSVSPGFGLPAGVETTPDMLQAEISEAQRQGDREREEQADRQYKIQESKLREASADVGITLVDEPVTLASAPRLILSKLIPKLNERLTGSGSTIGDPRIRAGTVLRLEGLGEQFGGLYRVTSATHAIDSGGYRTNFEVRKEVWFGSIPLPAQGAIPVRLQGQRLSV